MLEQKPLLGIRVLDLSRVLAGPYCTMIPNSTDSAYFYGVNRGKESVTLDLRPPEGAAIFLELAKLSDVVVENFSPGTMARFGLAYERLRQCNPRLILCSISGFGQSGP